ncbi:chorismate lyase [Psychromonas sp. MME2]|uniref:chorismate--pyruvate lyase family protein n=1 Tax=unclassified Psychromonas TaxID=2614957 RepID=UPI00339BC80F
MLNQLLPISFSNTWYSEIDTGECSETLRSWLFDQSSLTEKLEQQCNKFHVRLRQQIAINPQKNPLSGYFLNEKQLLVREVLLYCDDVAMICAQTEIPFSTLTAQQATLANLGEQSLGRVLFQDASMQRGTIEVCQFPEKSAVHQFTATINQACEYALWARRSFFYLNNKPLLVSELFLPASGVYQK